MDAARLRQRSASHSSLRSQYRYQSRMINYTNPRPPAQRHPLRRVNENPALLRSPGPLESMLKTTTETGDIGIFSIRPNSSSAPFDRPHRPRLHPRDVDLLLPARSSGYDENYYYHSDDHKRLRPYRDTTSEIISLYGSESQHTLSSSVSPASLEDDPRSYSMTTTSSKRIPSQKSTGTLQSQSSGSGFQRPRSPFPYPTRLKRPGVRPASPALRENGDIDYSRMVELERFSQRTIHGSYKPTYIHGSRRPPPLSLRAEANRSTTSLPSRPLHSPHFYAPASYHARPPNPSMAWMPRQPSRNQPYPTDQSTRSASLTSIVEMYDKPIASNQNCAPPQSTGSIYYDYSEQFEDRPPWDIDVDVPLHPIPQRAENIRQSLLLMDNIQGRFDIGENDSDSSESIMQEAEKDLMEPSHLSNTRERHSEGTEAKQLTLPDEHVATDIECSDLLNSIEIALNSISDKEQSQPPAVSIEASPVTKTDTADLGSMMSDPASTRPISPVESSSKLLKASYNIEEDLRSQPSSQNGRISKLRYSLDPALSDFASVLSSFDRIARVSISKDNEAQSSGVENNESSVYQQGEAEAVALKRPSERSPPPSSNKAGTEERAYQRRHRRHIATMMISTTDVASDGFSQNSPRRKDDVPILSPEPISPVRELRVKESIPQLMKSLPPLPREAQKLSGYGTVGSLPLPTCLGDEPLMPSKGGPSGMGQRFSFVPLSGSSQNMQSKFSTKAVASSPSHRIIGDATCSVAASRPLYNVLQDCGHSPAGQPKLKLKASHSQLDPVQVSQGGPSPYSNRLKQCNSLAELAPCDKNDGVDENFNTAMGGRTQVSNCESNSGSSAMVDEKSTRFQPSPQLSDQFNIPYPPSPTQTAVHSSPVTPKLGVVLAEAHRYDISSSEPRGLRGKLSMLRLRFTSPQQSTTASEENISMPCLGENKFSTFPTVASKGTDMTFGEMSSNKYLPPLPEMDKAEWRIKRWARDVKKAVRLYVKKTLDRSLKANS
ncbi:uncharacterized protein TrAtP1_004304 [Trichoderma atroviride]|uniref:Uncharacterized protein n=1 Tax=Hypocrea atroviridis (strain ATCC 20476 / IMI 206040) TaxID=452589 RepID=G9P8C9_HYPAI|nr:uncharacterized protein TRIATDRAFT_321203 [Trichoderma atroviride IMI 206040]EHK40922.1 hypothetical protein TRIATDRAFT_321203 [Trichoderma atroviride IMI 206040]UKZ63076.1 hypothetical protein TrAtP1_004304 [Trichoderma atroviride]